ncbi:phosphate ABC transporter permease PstA [Halomarina oriensis]|uniref:Phosphate transport system permease protein PstA n=1 Tax=Halomarina oriensis TaxID=671145 RepID=A0A6B0GIZ7_9EURY|nr:phosphate ABC transporter permease PstA [Halomarina oriensis]MWG34852.1 phosphate ABC transporter permease PstA [Halomarina oriensis]
MATDTRTTVSEGFGEVSRTVGTAFRYLLLAATLVGILAVGVLFVYVGNDAIQPLTADPGWHLTFFLTLVVPTLAVGGVLRARADGSFRVGLESLGLLAVMPLFAGGVATLFLSVLPALVTFSYAVALGLVVATVVALMRSRRVGFGAKLLVVGVATVVSLLFVPGIIQSLPFVPVEWLLVALTLGTPVAAIAGAYATSSWNDRRTGRIAGAAALGGVVAAGLLGSLIGFGGTAATILAAVAGVPVALYAATALDRHPARRDGLLLPLTVVGGMLLGAFLVRTVGFAGPAAWLDWAFLTGPNSITAEDAGIYPALVGSILLMLIVALLSFPVGIGAAVYLEEYAPDSRLAQLIEVNIANLAGVPSVVYGLLGLGLLARMLDEGLPILPAAIADPLGLEPVRVGANLFGIGTVFVGGMTLSLLILPIVIISSQEAIRSVPPSQRQASYGMGATRWQTIRNVVLPKAFPGILTGTILALGRAIGETAPLLVIGAPNQFGLPQELSSRVGAMPLQIYAWATTSGTPEFYAKVIPAGVVVLLVAMLAMNSVAIVLRNRFQS